MGKRLDSSRIVTKLIPIDAIKDHPDNYNQHPDEQITQLAASHEEFGQYRSILVWERPNGEYIRVVGHGYSKGAKQADETMLRVEVLPVDTPPDVVKAIMIADNLHAQNSSPDDEALARLLQEQSDAGFDLASLGTDDETLRQMLEALGDEYAGGDSYNKDEDDFDEEVDEEQIRVQVGDVWRLGRHKLIVGNSFDTEILNILMGDEKTSLLFCDPPYGMNFDPGMSMIGHNKGNWEHKPRHYDKVIGDDKDFDPKLFMDYFSYCKEQFWWGADYYAERIPERNKGAWFVWDKREGLEEVEFTLSHFELCWSRQKHTREIIRQRWMGLIGTESQDIRNRVHPTQKALQVCNFFIEKFSKSDDLVIDLFLGSGTTIISCERLGRRCYGCEIEPRFADIAIRRWEAESGEQAVLLHNVLAECRS